MTQTYLSSCHNCLEKFLQDLAPGAEKYCETCRAEEEAEEEAEIRTADQRAELLDDFATHLDTIERSLKARIGDFVDDSELGECIKAQLHHIVREGVTCYEAD